jgi:hypothetical protein
MLKIDAVGRFSPGCGDTSYPFGQRVTTGFLEGLAIAPISFTLAYSVLRFLQTVLMKG